MILQLTADIIIIIITLLHPDEEYIMIYIGPCTLMLPNNGGKEFSYAFPCSLLLSILALITPPASAMITSRVATTPVTERP